MAIEKTSVLYEVLIRLNPDGTVRGAHTIRLERVADGDTVLSERELAATPIDPAEVADLIGQNNATIVAENVSLRAAAEAAEKRAGEVEEDLAGKDQEIAALEARIAELTATAPDGSIHKAYFRAALAVLGHLVAVDNAVATQSVVKQELWFGATTIKITDPDVVAIADALDIDLNAVLAKALEIQAGDRTT